MSDVAFTFSFLSDESVFDRWVRLYEELLSSGPISHTTTPVRLSSFLDVISTTGQPVGHIGGAAVNDVSRWATNCAMTQHAGQVWCGRMGMRPYVNGEAITQYIELTKGGPRWVQNDGVAVPKGPAIFYVNPSARLGFDHVGAFGRPSTASPRVFDSYEGGGGDGTRIVKSSRHLDGPDSYGRLIAGWWEIDDLFPVSLPYMHPGGPADDDTMPHVTETGARTT